MMNQSGFLPITCNLLTAREKSRVRDEIDFGLVSHWLKKWREIFQPNTKRSNSTRAITFDSHLKTALSFDFLKKKKTTFYARSVGPFVFVHSEEANPGGKTSALKQFP